MAEEQVNNKKPVIISRILKWIGLVLLVLLLLTSLIFQAPWKVIALLFIILAACTVLPKPYRKWFWLSVAVVVLVLIIWVFLPEDNEGWRPYTFDEELAALRAKYEIPDSQNAATIYNALLENYDPNTMHPDFLDPNIEYLTLRELWSSKDYPELAKWLEDQQNTIEKLIEASRIQNCRFPIVANTIDMSKQIDRLSAMRHWTFLLIRAANNDLPEGRVDEALEKYIAVLQMAKHVCQQPLMSDYMYGIAVEGVAIAQLERFIVTGNATNELFEFMSKALPGLKNTWSDDWPIILDYEKLYTKNCFGRLYQVNEDDKVRFCRSPELFVPKESGITLSYWRRKIWKLLSIWYWFAFPHTPEKVARFVEYNFAKYYQMADPNYPWPSQSPELTIPDVSWLPSHFVALVMPSESLYHNFHDIYLEMIAKRRGIRILVSLRRYKNKTSRWPVSLDDIKSLAPSENFVDPVNGNSFVYKLTEENFTLYSKGKNNIDEEGHYYTKWAPDYSWHKVEEDDILIWSPKNRKTTKEEKANDEQQ